MKPPIDLARKFLAVADNDTKAFPKWAADADIADASIGFHAQHAGEKCLKTALALPNIKFQTRHDPGERLDWYEKHNLPLPPMMEVLDELNPYAVTRRYDWFDGFESMYRERTKEIVLTIRRWAEEQINGARHL